MSQYSEQYEDDIDTTDIHMHASGSEVQCIVERRVYHKNILDKSIVFCVD